jgi:hypothetical protein
MNVPSPKNHPAASQHGRTRRNGKAAVQGERLANWMIPGRLMPMNLVGAVVRVSSMEVPNVA